MEEPKSRFWACFFSLGILALFWTIPMKVTLKWVGTWMIPFGITMLLSALVDQTWYLGGPHPSDIEDVVVVNGAVVFSTLPYVLPIYFMWRWTTRYNLKVCGYKSKGEWKKSRGNQK